MASVKQKTGKTWPLSHRRQGRHGLCRTEDREDMASVARCKSAPLESGGGGWGEGGTGSDPHSP